MPLPDGTRYRGDAPAAAEQSRLHLVPAEPSPVSASSATAEHNGLRLVRTEPSRLSASSARVVLLVLTLIVLALTLVAAVRVMASRHGRVQPSLSQGTSDKGEHMTPRRPGTEPARRLRSDA